MTTDTGAVSPAPVLGRPLPLRAGFAGPLGLDALGGMVEVVDLAPRRGRAPEPGSLDALVIDPQPTRTTRERLVALAADVRARGGFVVGIDDGSADPAWAGLADVRLGPRRGNDELPAVVAGPGFDLARHNPTGFRYEGVAGLIALTPPRVDPAGIEAALPFLAAAGHHAPVLLRGPEYLLDRDLPGEVLPALAIDLADDEAPEVLQKRLGAIDHPGFHRSDWERAGWLVKLCAFGLPVVAADLSDEVRSLIGEELAGLLDEVTVADVCDLDLRERASVALRRVALRDHSHEARWRQICERVGRELPPRALVSVVFATRRADWLSHGLEQIERQNYEQVELVACLHGDGFPADVEELVRAAVSCPVTIIHPDPDLTLGEALNAGVEVAAGELITKMDDDDYYSVDHLWDLVLALEFAGAELTGKAAEFVYLEEIDVTIRQISHDVETRLAGGGMMARRGPLEAIGGWEARTRAEDLALIRAFANAERPIHRVPPHGYILNRHGRDHTWRPAVDYFLFRSERQWRGLRFDATAIR